MEIATRLALYLGCLVVALLAGWALGQATALLVPDLIIPRARARARPRGRIPMTAASLDPGSPSRFPQRGVAQCRTELLVGGMTCGACANRVERTLNKMNGVSATVNYATEKASVSFCDPVTVEDLVAAVERAGYTAALPRTTAAAG